MASKAKTKHVRFTKRQREHGWSVACPICLAPAGAYCESLNDDDRAPGNFHDARIRMGIAAHNPEPW